MLGILLLSQLQHKQDGFEKLEKLNKMELRAHEETRYKSYGFNEGKYINVYVVEAVYGKKLQDTIKIYMKTLYLNNRYLVFSHNGNLIGRFKKNIEKNKRYLYISSFLEDSLSFWKNDSITIISSPYFLTVKTKEYIYRIEGLGLLLKDIFVKRSGGKIFIHSKHIELELGKKNGRKKSKPYLKVDRCEGCKIRKIKMFPHKI